MKMSRDERKALNDKIHYKHFKLTWPSPAKAKAQADEEAIRHAFATVAYVRVNDGDVFYAITFCAPEDQFERKTGRFQAKRRLFEALKNKLCGHSGHLNAPADGPWPAAQFPPILRRWLHGARETGLATDRWYYDLIGTESGALTIEPLERKR